MDISKAKFFNSEVKRPKTEVFQAKWSEDDSVSGAVANRREAQRIIDAVIQELALQYPLAMIEIVDGGIDMRI